MKLDYCIEEGHDCSSTFSLFCFIYFFSYFVENIMLLLYSLMVHFEILLQEI